MDKPNILDQYKTSLVTVPTPVRSDILETKLQGYDKQQTVKLVNGFKFGFRLGFQRDTNTSSSAQNVKNHKSALQNREQVFLKLAKESIKKPDCWAISSPAALYLSFIIHCKAQENDSKI
jgi:hypothetical protein